MQKNGASALGTNDNVRVFRLLCILLGICKIGLSSNIVVVAFITHRIVTHFWGSIRVDGGVHDSYTFQCRLVGYFTSPGIDTR